MAHATNQGKGAEFVDKHREQLIQRLSSVMEIADCLLSKEMISGEMYSSVSAAATPQVQMRILYKSLESGGRAVKEEFYNILKKKHHFLVDDLDDQSSHHPESPAKATEMDEYKMSSKPRGVCLIINNMDFGDPKKYRHGSDKDEESLKKVFEWLGFTVEVHRNQTAEQIKTILKTWGKKKHEGDCFVCCILSHGSTNGVCGTDRQIVSREDIFSPFYGNPCRSLINKPKVFFIQACRGRQLHPTVQVQADAHKEEIAGDAETVILDGADFFVARSTIKGYFSLRTLSGSWFIQSLCEQLEQYCPEGEDINSILVRTNEEVSRRLGEIEQEEQNLIQYIKVKQMPIYNSTLRKRLVFKP